MISAVFQIFLQLYQLKFWSKMIISRAIEKYMKFHKTILNSNLLQIFLKASSFAFVFYIFWIELDERFLWISQLSYYV